MLANITAEVPAGFVIVVLLYLIYVKGLSDELAFNPQLSGDDNSLFSIIINQDKLMGFAIEDEF